MREYVHWVAPARYGNCEVTAMNKAVDGQGSTLAWGGITGDLRMEEPATDGNIVTMSEGYEQRAVAGKKTLVGE